MKLGFLFSVIAFLFVGVRVASAGLIDLSRKSTDWEKSPNTSQTADAKFETTSEGYLRGTKTTATGGSPWCLELWTKDTYDFQNATLSYKWKLNAQVGSNYAAIYLGIYNSLYNVDPNPPFAGHLTTHHSFGGSEVIPSDTWLWTQIMISPKGAGYGYDFSVSKTGYGNKDFSVRGEDRLDTNVVGWPCGCPFLHPARRQLPAGGLL